MLQFYYIFSLDFIIQTKMSRRPTVCVRVNLYFVWSFSIFYSLAKTPQIGVKVIWLCKTLEKRQPEAQSKHEIWKEKGKRKLSLKKGGAQEQKQQGTDCSR